MAAFHCGCAISTTQTAFAAWEREMQRIVSIVVAEMTSQLWPNGGPIIMLQIENEYSGNQTYLE
jgi:alpha-D-ribose 1-methylphosphonate 5-triphosphate synthase subunit PhnH